MADLLVIDDDRDNTEILTEILADAGHVVRTGFDGRDGLRLVLERCPDLILLDVEMPVLDGPGLMAQLRGLDDEGLAQIPVVLMSGAAGLRQLAARAGTPHFLAKPFDYDQLMGAVQRALGPPSAPRPANARA